VFVQAAEIAGMEPVAAQRLGIGFRILPIAVHYAVAAGNNLADLAGFGVAIILVDDPHQDAAAWVSAGGQPLAPARVVAVRVQALRQSGDRHRSLTLAVELVEARTENLQRTLQVSDVHR